MKALVVKAGAPVVQEIPVPVAGDNEVLVRIDYVAQNPTDWVRQSSNDTADTQKATKKAPDGRIIGCDFAGTVTSTNERVAGFVQGTNKSGSFAEYIAIDPSLLLQVPESVTLQEAATLPLALATAVQALHARLHIAKGDKVLINGGASSVGLYAIQVATLAGATVFCTASPRNHTYLTSLGAQCYDYKDTQWPFQVLGCGIEKALDCISLDTTPLERAMKGGKIVTLLPTKKSDRVIIESTIVYSIFGPLSYGNFDNCDTPAEDRALWVEWLHKLPGLLESGTIKCNKVTMSGSLHDIPAGFKRQEEGNVSAEKLVYKVSSLS